eukprot:3666278-Prymnesium_polylepis.1
MPPQSPTSPQFGAARVQGDLERGVYPRRGCRASPEPSQAEPPVGGGRRLRTRPPCHRATCHRATGYVSRATVLRATAPPCHRATVPPRHRATAPPCHRATVLPCH